MSFDGLWAGWRSAYVGSVSHQDNPDGTPIADPSSEAECVFCRILNDTSGDADRGVVATTSLSVAILNAFPYASGHLLVMPRRHVSEIEDLSAGESTDLWALAQRGVAAVKRAYAPDGMNLGANLGRAAGAGIPRHLHLHVVPRWIGDTNFMTSVASVRVLPEPLDRTWEKLHAAWSP